MFPLVLLAACTAGGSDEQQFSISGRVAMATARTTGSAAAPRTVTHVMAVNPESASPDRSIAKVGSDGSFELSVDVGKPYVFVFVDSTAVGADMVVAVFRARTLDTIAPELAGHLAFGDVMVDPSTQTATAGLSYDALLAGLGLSPAAAEYLGSIDDLSLRYANPDIDGDGVIDLEQDRRYGLDFHVRSNMRLGSSTGRNLPVRDIPDLSFADAGSSIATPVFNLTSAYVMYPSSLDSTQYVVQTSGPA